MNTGKRQHDRKYRTPPVVEALCEVYFRDSKWDDAAVGQFYELIKGQFPNKVQREMHEAQVRFSTKGEAAAGVRRLPPRIQFVTDAGDRMIQLGQDLLVVNQLRPYSSFEEWEKTIYEALASYQQLVSPVGLERVGLRYIDKVVLPGTSIRMEEFFEFYPKVTEGFGSHGPFMLRMELRGASAEHKLLVTLGSAPTENSESLGFVLDF